MDRWVKVDVDLFRKPKFLALVSRTRSSRLETAGALVSLWAWVQTYGPRTNLPASLVEEATGTPPGFVDALVDVGWAERVGDPEPVLQFKFAGTTFPELRDKRSEAGRRGAENRWQADGKRIAKAMAKGCQTKKETEKEKETKTEQDSPSGESSVDAVGATGRRRRTALTWSESGGFGGIEPELRKAWSEAAPLADVDVELAKAHAWMLGRDPARRKRNYRAFLTNWFLRVQESRVRSSTDGPSRGTLPLGCSRLPDGTIRTPSGAILGDNR